MRRYLLLFLILVLLNGCDSPQADVLSVKSEPERTLPRLPSGSSAQTEAPSKPSKEALKRELQEITKEAQRPNISKLDMQKGWYYGSKDGKKYGTPDSWVWIENEGRWMSPVSLESKELVDARTLCSETAGAYNVSCIDSEVENCQHIPQTFCQCAEGSKWQKEQGCLMTNETGEWVSISSDELTRGWYHGLPNEKKLNTPDNWVWVEDGKNSHWKNPRI